MTLSKGKGKAPARRSRRLSGGSPIKTPSAESAGAMLVYTIAQCGSLSERYCKHALFEGLEGKLRPMGKWVTMQMASDLMELLPVKPWTNYDKVWDRAFYQYTDEPAAGDINDDFRIDDFKDGRYFVNALVLDFVKEFGREARTGDKTSCQAYIIDRPLDARSS